MVELEARAVRFLKLQAQFIRRTAQAQAQA